jgi:hypothetical protein
MEVMMPKAKVQQLSFIKQLESLPIGKIISVPISESEIGGELLNILSKGLYTNPLDAIREYVQNSIDAGAKEVTIHVTGNSVNILDRGSGMNQNDLLAAREFGVSKKNIEDNVGFRGIGIYSGFDLCERLVILTKKKGEKVEHSLEFRFKDMREILEAARKDPKRPKVSLSNLLGQHTFYHSESSSRAKESYTIVQLLEVNEEHIYQLSNVEEMQHYILRNLPIRFSQNFKYGQQIEQALNDNVQGYKSARVILSIDNSTPIIVEKPGVSDVEAPRMSYIHAPDGRAIAYYWACLTTTRSKIKDAGFVYKIKGFTIGDRNYLRHMITRLYDWWTGEIYVLDTNVVPTSARDDFEASRAKQQLSDAVSEILSGSENQKSLQKIALKAQEKGRADEELEKFEKILDKFQSEFDSGDFDPFLLYGQLELALKRFKPHKNRATDQKLAKKLDKHAKTLQQELRNPKPLAERKREAVKSAYQGTPSTKDNKEEEDNNEDANPSNQNDAESDNNQESFISIMERLGWEINEETTELMEVVNEVVSDVLGTDNDSYRQILLNLEEKLGEILQEG